MNGFLVFLAIFLGVVAATFIAVLVIRHKLNKFTQSYLGKNVGETARMISQGLKDECRLPYSVPKLTPLYKPKIERDFPEMSFSQMESMAKNGMADILNAIENGKPQSVKHSSVRLRNQIGAVVEDARSNGEEIHYDSLKIHNVGVESYNADSEAASVVFQVALESVYYVLKDGKVKAGTKNNPTQNLFSVQLSHNQNLSAETAESFVGSNCPNCGAPVPAAGHGTCPYCGTGLVAVVDKIWQIDSYKLLK